MNTLGLKKQNAYEVARPQEGGRIVNPHVLSSVVELTPDYSAMQRLLERKDVLDKSSEKA